MRELTPKQERFALALLAAPTVTAAYEATYNVRPTTSRQSRHVAAYKLRHHPAIEARYQELMRERVMPSLTPDEARQVLAHVMNVINQDPA